MRASKSLDFKRNGKKTKRGRKERGERMKKRARRSKEGRDAVRERWRRRGERRMRIKGKSEHMRRKVEWRERDYY